MINKLKNFYITLIIILLSGTVFFSYIYYKEFIILLFISSILINGTKPINKKNILLLFLILIIILTNYFVYQNNIDGYIGLCLKVTSVLLLINNLDYNLFKYYFIKIIAFFCITSIILFVIFVINPNFIFGKVPIRDVWGTPIRHTLIHNFPVWKTLRNFGPFHEGGMFQVYINIAFLFVFETYKKLPKLLLLLFTITLITTVSTTGIIICGIIIISKISFKKSKSLLMTCFILVIALGFAEIKLGIISNKMDSNNPSYSARIKEFDLTKTILAKKPILGIGYQNQTYLKEYTDLKDSTNEILSLVQQFGIILSPIILSMYFIGIYNLSNKKIEFIIKTIIMCVFFGTEPTMFQPLFLCILFIRRDSKKYTLNEKNNRRSEDLNYKSSVNSCTKASCRSFLKRN